MSDQFNDFPIFLQSNLVKDELKLLPYGTAGYRMKSENLHGISIRVAVLGILKSIYEKAAIGLMITASHNPECDNGIKVIEYNGDMIPKKWENLALEIVRCENQNFMDFMNEKCKDLGIQISDRKNAIIIIGYDTRKSSPILSNMIKQTLHYFNCNFIEFENVTTPQLHFFVRQYNLKAIIGKEELIMSYFTRFTEAFKRDKIESSSLSPLNIDCANGVGSIHMKKLRDFLKNYLEIKLYNTKLDLHLNDQCGADHVKITQTIPVIYNNENVPANADLTIHPGDRWCSIDGDSDRLIYYFVNPRTNQFCLLDGDKIAVLFADYLVRIIESMHTTSTANLTIAIIQTAYANSASTQYIQDALQKNFSVNIQTVCVPTGVKYLHEAAKQYDVGIYFEANGHGTIVFSEVFRTHIKKQNTTNSVKELIRIVDLINEADGDAITDMLLIEHILAGKETSKDNSDRLIDWYNMYTDYPSRQLKVSVRDRSLFTTTDAERRLVTPSGLQVEIDKLVSEHSSQGKHARCFVRPSGTEDIVRVYAEASNQSETDKLANQVAELVRKT